MPWHPFFDKMKKSDVFVYLTECQFEPRGYQNRFHYGDDWFTMPCKKGRIPIKDKIYVNPKDSWEKMKAKIPYPLEIFDDNISENLTETNIAIIERLCRLMNIKTERTRDYPTELTSSERLADICERYGGTTYLSGTGGMDYLDEEAFTKRGINVMYQNTKHISKAPILEYIFEPTKASVII